MTGNFKIKLTRKELTVLLELYILFIDRWESENALEELLLVHAIHFYRTMEKVAVNRPQEKFTFKLQPPDALAMWQWWQMINTADQGYGNIIVCRIVGEIDKDFAQLQVGEPENLNEG